MLKYLVAVCFAVSLISFIIYAFLLCYMQSKVRALSLNFLHFDIAGFVETCMVLLWLFNLNLEVPYPVLWLLPCRSAGTMNRL